MNKGFAAPLLIILTAVAIIGLGFYVYKANVSESPDSQILATISQTGSTNSAPFEISIYKDGSAKLDIAHGLKVKEFGKATVDANRLQSLLETVGNVSWLQGVPAPKSASFGTRTYITYKGTRSGDLQELPQDWPKSGRELTELVFQIEKQLINSENLNPLELEEAIKPSGNIPPQIYIPGGGSGYLGIQIDLIATPGTEFTPQDNEIYFDNKLIDATSSSDYDHTNSSNYDQVFFTIPRDAALGKHEIYVQNERGRSNVITYEVTSSMQEPMVTSIQPPSGPPGTTITIKGKYLKSPYGDGSRLTLAFTDGPQISGKVAADGSFVVFTIPNEMSAEHKVAGYPLGTYFGYVWEFPKISVNFRVTVK